MEKKGMSRRGFLCLMGTVGAAALAAPAYWPSAQGSTSEVPLPPAHQILIKSNGIPVEASGLQALPSDEMTELLDEIGWGLYQTENTINEAYINKLQRAGLQAEENGWAFGQSEQAPDIPFDDPERSGQWDLDMIGLEQAYGYILRAIPPEGIMRPEEKITVAIVDSGIASNEQNQDAPVPGAAISMFDSGNPVDGNGHGTATVSTFAITDNGLGIAGACPQNVCQVISAKVLDGPAGSIPMGTWAQVAAGIVWSVDNGARVINLSLGARSSPQVIANAIEYALEKGVVVVAASGNDGKDSPIYPASGNGVIAVGANVGSGDLWIGSTSPDKPDHLSLVAPTMTESLGLDNNIKIAGGTSRSAPYAAALIGLLLSMGATPEMATEALLYGATDIEDPGYDSKSGHGIISVEGSVRYLMDTYDWRPPAQLFFPLVQNGSRQESVYLPIISVQ